jgi:hypothetical protein
MAGTVEENWIWLRLEQEDREGREEIQALSDLPGLPVQ